MRIRQARPEEYAAIAELTVAAYQPLLDHASASYVAQLRDTEARATQAELWVAVDGPDPGTEILGTVTVCRAGSPWREIAEPDEGEFRMLAVAPTAQGRGIGEALVGHVVELFVRDGARAVVLSTTPRMLVAHRLYQRLGFTRCAGRDWSPLPGVDLLAFCRVVSGHHPAGR